MKCFFSTVLLLVLGVFSLSAMTNCPAPAPTEGAIVNESESTIELRWEEVPGANSYEVTAIDLSDGNSISTNILDVGEYVQTNLETGRDYQFEIRASYCWGGPYGQPLVLRAKTTIIIVDVILQIVCDDEGGLETVYSGSIEADDNTMISIPSEDEGCYLFEITTEDLDPNVNLSMVVNANALGGLTINNVLSNASNFNFLGSRPLRGILLNPPPDKNIPIVDIDARKGGNGSIETQFTWHEDLFLNITYCEDCELIKPGYGRINNPPIAEIKENEDVKIYPNPVANLLQLQIPKKGLVQIWDMTGKSWFHTVSEDNEDIEIDTSNWPSGTYTLRWNEGSESPPKIKLFLKL